MHVDYFLLYNFIFFLIADKTKKLKQAKEEAASDIEQFRNECEAKFREKQRNVNTYINSIWSHILSPFMSQWKFCYQ